MPTKQIDGRIAQAELIAAQKIYVAWGRGNPDWTEEDKKKEPVDSTSLFDEIGRRLATQVAFVYPDEGGGLETPTGNYAYSDVPTRYLAIRCVFGFEEAQGETIREIGIFMNSVTDPGLPPGQRYFTPDQVVASGRMLIIDRAYEQQRHGAARPTFEYVLPY